MAERLNAAVLKTVLGNTNGGSNPSLSATTKNTPRESEGYFYFTTNFSARWIKFGVK